MKRLTVLVLAASLALGFAVSASGVLAREKPRLHEETILVDSLCPMLERVGRERKPHPMYACVTP